MPAELDALNEEVVVTASIGLGFTIAHPPGHRVFSIELGSGAHGRRLARRARPVRATSARSIARKRSRTSSSTSSRPGIRWSKASLRTTKTARSAASVRFEIKMGNEADAGLVAIYKDGPDSEVVAIDSDGRVRTEWAAAIRQRPLRARPVAGDPTDDSDWTAMVRRLGAQLDPVRRPHAIAAVLVRPAR